MTIAYVLIIVLCIAGILLIGTYIGLCLAERIYKENRN